MESNSTLVHKANREAYDVHIQVKNNHIAAFICTNDVHGDVFDVFNCLKSILLLLLAKSMFFISVNLNI